MFFFSYYTVTIIDLTIDTAPVLFEDILDDLLDVLEELLDEILDDLLDVLEDLLVSA